MHLEFAHEWQAEVLERRPIIAPARQFFYPQHADEIEHGALEVRVRPAHAPEFLATFALGFADLVLPSGLWSCPNPAQICAVAGGYGYLVDTRDPQSWQQVPYRPVLEVRQVPDKRLLLFVGHHAIAAYGFGGKLWESARLSWEGVKIVRVAAGVLTGTGWDLMADQEFEFRLDLATGERIEN